MCVFLVFGEAAVPGDVEVRLALAREQVRHPQRGLVASDPHRGKRPLVPDLQGVRRRRLDLLEDDQG